MKNFLNLFSGIRNRLAAIIAIICFAIVTLTFVLQTILLVPTYNNLLDSKLSEALATVTNVLSGGNVPNGILEIQELASTGICIEISDADTMKPMLIVEGIGSQCLLHSGNPGNEVVDNANLLSMRMRAVEEIEFKYTMSSESDNNQQRVFGSLINDGNLTLIVSTDLEQIDVASEVISQQIYISLLLIIPIAVAIAFVFAGYFTAPISELGKATKQISAGNYDIKLDTDREDELGELANDFSIMTVELRRTSNLKDELLGNISHDLRTPLTLIKGYAETIRDFTGEVEEKRNEQLDIIINETDRLSGFISNVMELSKQNSGETPLELCTFDLCQYIADIVTRERHMAQMRGVTINLNLPNNEIYIDADPRQLDSAIHNLIENAVHHVGEDKIVVVGCDNTVTPIKIYIEDHGKGIGKEDINFIFDRYYRARADRGESGSGLGLAIVKSTFVRHGFNFGVDSSLGNGSTFWFTVDNARERL